MRTETHRLLIDCPRDGVWRFLSDYRNDLEWRRELSECELMAGSPGEVGAVYRAVIGWEGLVSECEVECIASEQSALIAYRSCVASAPVTCEYRLEDEGDGTAVTVTLTIEMDSAFTILEPFAWAMLTRWGRVNAPELPRACARVLA